MLTFILVILGGGLIAIGKSFQLGALPQLIILGLIGGSLVGIWKFKTKSQKLALQEDR
jgi:hypothetical protein